MKNIITYGLSVEEFMIAWFFLFLGFVFHKLTRALFRDRSSQRTPAPFDVKFWWLDNWKEMCWHIILMYFAVLFSPWLWGKFVELPFVPEDYKQWAVDMPHAIVSVGFGWLIAMPINWWKKKGKEVTKAVKTKLGKQ